MELKIAKYRRWIQAVFFAFFVGLLLLAVKQTALPFPTQLFLNADPLIVIVSIIVGLPLTAMFLYSLITVAVTIIFGRVFCGYACPMGSVLDLFSPLANVLHIEPTFFKKLKVLPFAILAAVLTLGIFKIGVVMALDPVSMMTRATTVTITFVEFLIGIIKHRFSGQGEFSGFGRFFDVMEANYPSPLSSSGWIILLLLAIIALNLLGRRFWCRYLCPLGAMLSLIGLSPLFKRKIDSSICTNCEKCARSCEMDAITSKGLSTDNMSCVMCLECRDICPPSAVSWGLQPELTTEMPSRRNAIAVIGGSLAVAAFAPLRKLSAAQSPILIRPPGVSDEDKFTAGCTRCGECMASCPTKVLQPALLQYGIEGLWTPHMDFSSGVCDYYCNNCGQACPTGAIKNLDLNAKQSFVIGKAELYRDLCIRWVRGRGCGICVEACPVPDRAIKLMFANGGFSGPPMPYVKPEFCIGCGICEAVCPVQGQKAIQVVRSATGRLKASDTIE